ncbi:hypothetical protein C0989_009952 [Termitomyces sp. Mn162]|nr:hypothetical protein C0989_009952 [Termitomyces sp. Mn162]
MSWFEEPSTTTYFFSSSFLYVSPFGLMQDLISAALRILQDQDLGGLFDDTPKRARSSPGGVPPPTKPRGLLMNFVRRFVLGLPMVGAGSLVYMLLSAPFIGPLQFLARRRSGRNRQDQSRDIVALVIVALILAGAAKALHQVYRVTEQNVKRLLLRAEEVILEVN